MVPTQLVKTKLGFSDLRTIGIGLRDDHAALSQELKPVTETEILETLGALAETFQVELPDDTGLEIYVRALSAIPRPSFVRARDALVRQHRWPRLPYPVDFIEAAAPTTQAIETTILIMERRMKLCRATLKMLQASSKQVEGDASAASK